ncbi:MAG: type I DNA topoisomerase, partial [Patescibacteria group bacterium]
LVGYKLSPFLWKKIYRGLSAGRVQSVAVRLIVEREREIQNFKPQEYWTILAKLETEKKEFEAVLVKKDGETLDKFAIKNKQAAEEILAELSGKDWLVEGAEKKEVLKNPPAPFTTSTLQQEAFRRLGFTAKQTMLLAQQLYEGVELGEGPVGLITYMRTDSLNLSQDSLAAAGEFLNKDQGKEYALKTPRHFKTKTKGAQEAHEAIRPTDPARTPESIKKFLNLRQWKLYNLIWRRFLASQMPEALFDAATADLKAGRYTFRATGQAMKFDGFLKIYPLKFLEVQLPQLEPGQKLNLREITPLQHFTEPPPRWTEASLVKILEKYGIGRPSTYAPIIATIQERGYVQRNDKKRLVPTEIGFIVNDMLVEHFPEIVDIQFTAKMEEELDEVASGEISWQKIIREFYGPFSRHLAEKYESVEKRDFQEATDELCLKCGKPMVIKRGRFGRFLACSGFPECKNTKPLPPVSLNLTCLKCHEGEIVERSTRRGKIFYGCSRWPKCDFASWSKPNGQTCPQCSSPLVEVKGGIKCSSKSCDFQAKELPDKPKSEL